jgi:hypothetical protein
LKVDKGLALQDMLTEIFEFITMIEFPRNTHVHLVDALAEIE